MSLDLTLLRLVKNKDRFARLMPGVPETGLDETTHTPVSYTHLTLPTIYSV